MAIISKTIKLDKDPYVSAGAGELSKDSYLLIEIVSLDVEINMTHAEIKYSLYAKSSKNITVTARIEKNDNSTVSKSVSVGKSMNCVLTATETIDGQYGNITTWADAYIEYKDSGEIFNYGITTNEYGRHTILFDSGYLETKPEELKYGELGTYTFDKASSYKLNFCNNGGTQYTYELYGKTVEFAVPASVFKRAGNLTSLIVDEYADGNLLAKRLYSVSVTETACSCSVKAYRLAIDMNNVVLSCSGESAESSTSRTIAFYIKETSATGWQKLTQTISPTTAKFADQSITVELSQDYIWDIYAELTDDYTTAKSAKVRIFSKAYIMDVRTDGKGIAFGGTAANKDEIYCGFKNLRAENITPSDITGIANLIYPVGSIYMSVNSTSPSTLFGGKWERIQDRFLLAAGSTYAAGKMDGSADAVVVRHSHGQSSHAHSPSDGEQYGFMEYKQNVNVSRTKVKTDSSSAGRYAILGTSGASSAKESNLDFSHYTSFATPKISDSGVSGEGKNMPPYLTVYMWKRTA